MLGAVGRLRVLRGVGTVPASESKTGVNEKGGHNFGTQHAAVKTVQSLPADEAGGNIFS
jgi:hypothetical protein